MKIAIDKKELEKNTILNNLFMDLENEYIIFDSDNFDINEIKKQWINVLVTSNTNLISSIYSSVSLSTSTYVISDPGTISLDGANHFVLSEPLNDQNVSLAIRTIGKNRIPSVEKIANRYYTDEQLKSKFPRMTETEFLRSKKLNPDLLAYEYFGERTSHLDHQADVVKYARLLTSWGVKPGDFVSICMPNTPELIKLRYALEDMGCTANFIDPRANSETMLHCLNTAKSTHLFILDGKYQELNKIVDKTNLDTVFLLSPFESIGRKNSKYLVKKIYDFSQKKKGNRPTDSGYKYFNDFMSIEPSDYKKAEYDASRISSIQYTSGTTGKPKPVMLNGNSFNCRVHSYQYDESEIILREKDRLLQALPMSGLAFGEYAMQMGLCKGMENVLVPSFTPEGLGKMLYENKINAMVMPPLALYKVLDSKYADKIDFSNIRMIAIGGEGMSSSKVKEINQILESKNCPVHIVMGGGCTEGVVCNTTVTYNHDKPGSAGIPLLGNSIKIIDKDGKEVGYGERGYIYYDPEGPMLGYYQMPELTEKVMTENGINIGDIGSIDGRGFVDYIGRDSQVIRLSDRIIYPRDIEEEISTVNGVDFCTVAGKNGEIRLFYTIKQGYQKEERDFVIEQRLREKFPDISEKVEIIALNNMPFTKNCKTDREKLAGDINELDLYQSPEKSKLFKRKKR